MAFLNVQTKLDVVLLICDALAEEGPTPKSQLVDICNLGLEDTNLTAVGSINALNGIDASPKFFQESKSEKIISFADEFKEITSWTPQERLDRLPETLRKALFTNPLRKDFMKSSEGTNDIIRALAWLLAQEDISLEQMLDLEVEQIANKEDRILDGNTSRLRNLREWGTFLGFIDMSDAKTGATDPTKAIKDTLPDIFEKKKELTAHDFKSRLSEEIPILDGGKFRNAVEKSLNEKWVSPGEGNLSGTLSKALWRLHEDPTVNFLLEFRDDGKSIKLSLGSLTLGWNSTSFSHVRLAQMS